MTRALVPLIDKTFCTIPDRDPRAMAGLSMGGMETHQITFNQLDLFSCIGGFSGAGNPFLTGTKFDVKTAYDGSLADPTAFAERAHLLWIDVGTNKPERMKSGLESLYTSVNEGGVQHVFYESPGTDHEWQTWRCDVKEAGILRLKGYWHVAHGEDRIDGMAIQHAAGDRAHGELVEAGRDGNRIESQRMIQAHADSLHSMTVPTSRGPKGVKESDLMTCANRPAALLSTLPPRCVVVLNL